MLKNCFQIIFLGFFQEVVIENKYLYITKNSERVKAIALNLN